jgi:DNA topoisomerase IA
MDPVVAARYWRSALHHLSFADLGRAPVLKSHGMDIGRLGYGSTIGDTPPEEVQDVLVVACLCPLDRRGLADLKARRHMLWAVPALWVKKSGFAPRLDAITTFNSAYLAPTTAKVSFEIGGAAEVDAALRERMAAYSEDEPTWSLWWQLAFDALKQATGAHSQEEVVAGLIAHAVEAEKRPQGGDARSYGLFGLVMAPTSGSGVNQLDRVYRFVEDLFGDYTAEFGLFRRLCGPAVGKDIRDLSRADIRSVSGHIDAAEGDVRSLYPLDATQRVAVQAALGLVDGEIQAVNGPPGSGKTSMLKAVVASLWVNAALEQGDCPIIIACGATNQSVTNVIGGFGDALSEVSTLPHIRRWLPNAPSYGAFLPAKSILSDPERRKDYASFVCLTRRAGPFPYQYVDRPDPLHPTASLDAEPGYVVAAAAALSCPRLDTLEDAIAAVWKMLRSTVEADPFSTAEAILATQGRFWKPARQSLAQKLLAAAPTSAPDLEELLDITVRSEAFHWAARYWEGRFLLAQRERLLTLHPNNVEEALRRLAMLTPCLVSTLHTAPQFAEISRESKGPDEPRPYVPGIIDLLVVDEAGQASPELGGALFALARRALVVGDMKQLAPIWANSPLAELAVAVAAGAASEIDGLARARRSISSGSVLGMSRSVSKWREGADDGLTLRYHYRCKPSIIQYCNELCYNQTLKPKTDENAHFPLPAVGWVEVDAAPRQFGGSWRNDQEATEIADWLVEQWPQLSAAQPGEPIKDILAIITPYRPQSDALAERLVAAFAVAARRHTGNWPTEKELQEVTVGTVHRLQGAEKPLVCFSLVEGPEQAAGSFIDRDTTMLNVAVSRAKSSFVLFGNPERLLPRAEGGELPPSLRLGAYLRRTAKRPLYPTSLVVIESPTKQKTIQKILGKSALVISTHGAMQTLPLKDGVDIAGGLIPHPVRGPKTDAVVAEAIGRLANVDDVILTTDDDRMGEYISWQFTYLLRGHLTGKTVRRARLGAITPKCVRTAIETADTLDERLVLAEMARDVLDAMISARFSSVLARAPAPSTAERTVFSRIGACTDGPTGKASTIGRVQAAVLRFLIDQARAVAEADERRMIEAELTIEGAKFCGSVFLLDDGRDWTSAKTASAFARHLYGLKLKLDGLPIRLVEPLTPPAPGTVEILAHSWRRHGIAPASAMAALQALFEGSWTEGDEAATEPVDPIEASSADGHPPISPLDRASPPACFKGIMDPEILAVYEAVWDYHTLAEGETAAVETLSIDAVIQPDDGSEPLYSVRFKSLSCSGVPSELEEIALGGPASNVGLSARWRALNGAGPIFTARPILSWDVTPASLLEGMRDSKIGRPSTYVTALKRLTEKQLIEIPRGNGVIRLTPRGLATALILEQLEPTLSAVGFSAQMSQALERIESGDRRPADVLDDLMKQLGDETPGGTKLEQAWESLASISGEMARSRAKLQGPLVTAPQQGGA